MALISGLCGGALSPAIAQLTGGQQPPVDGSDFTLSSSELVDGEALPDGLKCTRDGGDGLSPPLEWTDAPEGTEGYAIVMQHYPHGRYPGIDEPSHYWLVWDIPASAAGVDRGNTTSLGYEGSDKDMQTIGYTPPCSPGGAGTHEYTITVYAVDGALEDLPTEDDGSVDWQTMMAALQGHVLAASSLSFMN